MENDAVRVPTAPGLRGCVPEPAAQSQPEALVPSRNEIQVALDCIIISCEHSEHHARGAAALRTINSLVAERDRLYGLAKANNQLAAMNGDHRDEWRTKAALYADALEAILNVRVEGWENIWAGSNRCQDIARAALAKARGQ